jgi:asparagine synthase (glutamine-hydrolysing)
MDHDPCVAEELLDEARLKREGFFRPAPIREKWSDHLSGRGNWEYWLWDVLMFQAWLARKLRVLQNWPPLDSLWSLNAYPVP